MRATGGASLCVTRNRATVCNSSNLRHVCDGVQGVGTSAEIPAPRYSGPHWSHMTATASSVRRHIPTLLPTQMCNDTPSHTPDAVRPRGIAPPTRAPREHVTFSTIAARSNDSGAWSPVPISQPPAPRRASAGRILACCRRVLGASSGYAPSGRSAPWCACGLGVSSVHLSQ